ncbi:alpha/beta hydrolase [Maricaulis sp. D1M11]|uniref:alpha/beta hydrolase n=1 Tax=Maricaulis sp. D1M11 TaxID=3076117 RepID=UPI0039B44F8F
MSEPVETLVRSDAPSLAYVRHVGAADKVGCVWLGGFHSEMAGTKARHFEAWARADTRSYLRFDYRGHGCSGGEFASGTVSQWRQDVLDVIDDLTAGPQILIGSSMGGWLALLAALARAERIAGLVLIAPAVDFTQRLILPRLSDSARQAIDTQGQWLRPSAYGDGPYPITRQLLEDGAQWSLLPGPIPIDIPVLIVQGGADPDVPADHVEQLMPALVSGDVDYVLRKSGDHRLSTPADLDWLALLASGFSRRVDALSNMR